MRIRSLVIVAVLGGSLGLWTPADALPFALAAREDEASGSRPGTRRLDGASVGFETGDTKQARRWAFDDVRQIRIESSNRLVIETYQSRGWRRAGRSRAIGVFEGAREHVRPLLFTLKADLPSGMYDVLWRQVNRRSTTQARSTADPKER